MFVFSITGVCRVSLFYPIPITHNPLWISYQSSIDIDVSCVMFVLKIYCIIMEECSRLVAIANAVSLDASHGDEQSQGYFERTSRPQSVWAASMGCSPSTVYFD